jgi:hypothetical protein
MPPLMQTMYSQTWTAIEPPPIVGGWGTDGSNAWVVLSVSETDGTLHFLTPENPYCLDGEAFLSLGGKEAA